jgi:hypothetical protein
VGAGVPGAFQPDGAGAASGGSFRSVAPVDVWRLGLMIILLLIINPSPQTELLLRNALGFNASSLMLAPQSDPIRHGHCDCRSLGVQDVGGHLLRARGAARPRRRAADAGVGARDVGGFVGKGSKVNPGSPLGQPWVSNFWRASVGPCRNLGNGGSR